MSSPNEVERLRQVYSEYGASDATRSRWSAENVGNQCLLHERTDVLRCLLTDHGLLPLTEQRILDVGCGVGKVLAGLTEWGAQPKNLYGVDLLQKRIEAAQKNFPDIWFQEANAERLQFEDDSFDMILFFTVFSSILDNQMAHHVAGEALRVLKPSGAIVWYDFRYRNPGNPNTRPIRSTDIQELFPGFNLDLRAVTLLPPLARRLGRLAPYVYHELVRIPFLRTHLIGVLSAPTACTV